MNAGKVVVKTPEQIEGMRASGRLLARALALVEAAVEPGVTTNDLNTVADEFIRDNGGTPSFLGVPAGSPGIAPFPGSICASTNDVIVHGIPSGNALQEGDIIGIDCGVILDGWHSDSAVTVAVGEVDDEAERLIAVTRNALYAAVAVALPGNRLGDVGAAVQGLVESAGFAVVRRFVGHGIGRTMHEPPQVPNFGTAGTGAVLEAGTALAIEPMVNVGSPDVRFDADGWTARSADGSLSAHFEHTMVVGATGPIVLTQRAGA
ncbi:MAG: type I methionyl aminopeptidase [Chloroflexi bacterium]|nr:type I methionyl aminopeptidase [Chloroflexota bacterium]